MQQADRDDDRTVIQGLLRNPAGFRIGAVRGTNCAASASNGGLNLDPPGGLACGAVWERQDGPFDGSSGFRVR